MNFNFWYWQSSWTFSTIGIIISWSMQRYWSFSKNETFVALMRSKGWWQLHTGVKDYCHDYQTRRTPPTLTQLAVHFTAPLIDSHLQLLPPPPFSFLLTKFSIIVSIVKFRIQWYWIHHYLAILFPSLAVSPRAMEQYHQRYLFIYLLLYLY